MHMVCCFVFDKETINDIGFCIIVSSFLRIRLFVGIYINCRLSINALHYISSSCDGLLPNSFYLSIKVASLLNLLHNM